MADGNDRKKNGQSLRKKLGRVIGAILAGLVQSGWLIQKQRHDFSQGPVWDEILKRWLVEIRFPDDSRIKAKRFRTEEEAWVYWNAWQEKIRDGTWNANHPKNVTFGKGADVYRDTMREKKSF